MTPVTGFDLNSHLRRIGIVAEGESPAAVPLPGGVSSDIWRIGTPRGPVCVKRALPRLKVGADWCAPVERNAYEVLWFKTVAQFLPSAVPQILAHDPGEGFFVMAYLDPDLYPVWKHQLRVGRIDLVTAAVVGRRLSRIHAGTASRPDLEQCFDTAALFHALRLEPYFEAAARAHPDAAEPLLAVSHQTAVTKRALVHGDISPKNILIGPDGPVFLDAECACYGDPAFDLAFCLNHLLLKCLWTRQAANRYVLAYRAVADGYMRGVNWEPPEELEARAARLVPALMLARIDGKSPVEYIEADEAKERVRRFAKRLLETPRDTLAAVARSWAEDLAQ